MKIHLSGKNLWLNYNHLYYFMTVATEGSIVEAAKKLSLGAPALSIQLKQFEENIGRQLFQRSHKKLMLTENGKVALAYARELFQLGNEMVEVLYDRPNESKIHVQIGALDTIPKNLVLQLGEQILKRKSTLTILEGKFDELMRELSNHRIDLVLSNQVPTGNPGIFYTKKIARLPLVAFGNKNFIKLRKNFPQSMDKKSLIVPTPDNHLRHQIDHYFRLRGLNPFIIAETQDVMVQKLMAHKGLGLIIVPEVAVSDSIEKKELYPIGKLQDIYEELFLVSASRRMENPVANQMMKSFSII